MGNCILCSKKSFIKIQQLNTFTVIKCRNCGLLAIDPLPDERFCYNVYNSLEYWSRPYFRNCYVDYHSDKTIKMYEWALDYFSKYIPNKGQLLDVGCGPGVFLDIAKKKGWSVCGIECSEYAVEYGRKNFGLNILNRSVEEFDNETKHFDVITLWDVIEHLRAPDKALRILSKALKRDGIILIYTPAANSFVRSSVSFLDKLFKPEPKSFVDIVYSPLHLFYFSKSNLSKKLKSFGINIIKARQIPMNPSRASHANPKIRLILNLLDYIGGGWGRMYRFIMIGKIN